MAAQVMLDIYSLKARLWPSLIAGLPAASILSAVFPKVEWWHAGLLGTGAAAGLTFLLAQVARGAGKRKEPFLFKKWGGKPTTRLLRHRHTRLDQHTLARYHENVQRLSSGLIMPTLDAERSDSNAADATYEAAGKMLINKTRDTKRFALLFKENIHYGFCRNLWGLKPIGISIACISMVCAGVIIYRGRNAAAGISPFAALAGVVSLCLLAMWSFWITRDWVRIAADAYAERLLEASDDLVAETGRTSMAAKSASAPAKPGKEE